MNGKKQSNIPKTKRMTRNFFFFFKKKNDKNFVQTILNKLGSFRPRMEGKKKREQTFLLITNLKLKRQKMEETNSLKSLTF